MVRCPFSKGKIIGSIPIGSSSASIAQLGERKTEDLEVPRSIRGGSTNVGLRSYETRWIVSLQQ